MTKYKITFYVAMEDSVNLEYYLMKNVNYKKFIIHRGGPLVIIMYCNDEYDTEVALLEPINKRFDMKDICIEEIYWWEFWK